LTAFCGVVTKETALVYRINSLFLLKVLVSFQIPSFESASSPGHSEKKKEEKETENENVHDDLFDGDLFAERQGASGCCMASI
jgi:hypothetical protein